MFKMLRAAAVLIAAALVLGPSPAEAQLVSAQRTTILAYGYDLDSTTMLYPYTTGTAGLIGGDWIQQPIKIKTSGSSTTVTANTASTSPFAQVAVGDLIRLERTEASLIGGQALIRRVVTRTDANNITVDTAIDLTSGYAFTYRKATNGTTSSSGWVGVTGATAVLFQLDVQQITTDTAGIIYQVECKLDGGDAVIVIGPTTLTDVAQSVASQVTGPWDYCRFGFKIKTADDGTDTGSAQEKLNVLVSTRR